MHGFGNIRLPLVSSDACYSCAVIKYVGRQSTNIIGDSNTFNPLKSALVFEWK